MTITLAFIGHKTQGGKSQGARLFTHSSTSGTEAQELADNERMQLESLISSVPETYRNIGMSNKIPDPLILRLGQFVSESAATFYGAIYSLGQIPNNNRGLTPYGVAIAIRGKYPLDGPTLLKYLLDIFNKYRKFALSGHYITVPLSDPRLSQINFDSPISSILGNDAIDSDAISGREDISQLNIFIDPSKQFQGQGALDPRDLFNQITRCSVDLGAFDVIIPWADELLAPLALQGTSKAISYIGLNQLLDKAIKAISLPKAQVSEAPKPQSTADISRMGAPFPSSPLVEQQIEDLLYLCSNMNAVITDMNAVMSSMPQRVGQVNKDASHSQDRKIQNDRSSQRFRNLKLILILLAANIILISIAIAVQIFGLDFTSSNSSSEMISDARARIVSEIEQCELNLSPSDVENDMQTWLSIVNAAGDGASEVTIDKIENPRLFVDHGKLIYRRRLLGCIQH